ncbi:MAG: glycosyltransferase [Bryobacterales bacterium]
MTSIANAIDTTVFQPEEPVERDEIIIGGAGNFIPQKRFDLLIHAFGKVHQDYPRARLVLAGEGADEQDLVRLADRMGIADSVTFLGFQSDMARFYNSLDMFVISSDSEAAPFVALEAASCGVPVVSTSVGDVPDWFHDGTSALIAPCGSADALAERMIRLVGDPALRKQIGAAARNLMVEKYSSEQWRLRMKEWFEQVGS